MVIHAKKRRIWLALGCVGALQWGCLDAFPAPPAGEPVTLDGRDDGVPGVPGEDARPRTGAPDVGPDAVAVRDAAPPRVDEGRPPPRDMRAPPPPDAQVPDPPDEGVPLPPDTGPPRIRRVGPGDLVLNEVDYNQPGDDDAEFIELLVKSRDPVDLDGVRIELYSDGGAASVACGDEDPPQGGPTRYRCGLLPPLVLDPGAYLVLTAEGSALGLNGAPVLEVLGPQRESGNIQNGGEDTGDGILLTAADGRVLDGLAYEGLLIGIGEGRAAPGDDDSHVDEGPQPPERSLSRCPDGFDSDDNKTDFELQEPSPGQPNSCRD